MKKNIFIQDFYKLIREKHKFVLLDVRNHYEIKNQNIPQQYLLEIQKVDIVLNNLVQMDLNQLNDQFCQNIDIICLCQHGVRSQLAMKFLNQFGFNAFNFVGGIVNFSEKELVE